MSSETFVWIQAPSYLSGEVDGGVGWVARLFDIINNSAQAEVGARAELGNKDFSIYIYIYFISVKYTYKIAT